MWAARPNAILSQLISPPYVSYWTLRSCSASFYWNVVWYAPAVAQLPSPTSNLQNLISDLTSPRLFDLPSAHLQMWHYSSTTNVNIFFLLSTLYTDSPLVFGMVVGTTVGCWVSHREVIKPSWSRSLHDAEKFCPRDSSHMLQSKCSAVCKDSSELKLYKIKYICWMAKHVKKTNRVGYFLIYCVPAYYTSSRCVAFLWNLKTTSSHQSSTNSCRRSFGSKGPKARGEIRPRLVLSTLKVGVKGPFWEYL